MKTLRKIYFSNHALGWLDMLPDGKTLLPSLLSAKDALEEYPGRCELGYRRDLEMKERVYRLIREAREDDGIFFLPSYYGDPTRHVLSKESKALVELAEKLEHFFVFGDVHH